MTTTDTDIDLALDDISRANDERVARCRRIATIASVVTFVGTVMLVARLAGTLTDLNVPPLVGPLGVLLMLPAWIVTVAANQLAERYGETAQDGGHNA